MNRPSDQVPTCCDASYLELGVHAPGCPLAAAERTMHPFVDLERRHGALVVALVCLVGFLVVLGLIASGVWS